MGERLARPDPFRLAFGPFVPDRFEGLRGALVSAGTDLFDRDAWLLSRPGVELLRELRPDGGLGEGVDELVALAHAGFLYWQQGERVIAVSRAALDRIVGAPDSPAGSAGGRTAYYVDLAPRRMWGRPVAEAAAEPLDGWFAVAAERELILVAVFGMLPDRPGFTVVHVRGPAPQGLARPDGSPPFTPVLAGGAAAGLWSVIGGEELLDLGWRVHRRIVAAGGPAPGRSEVAA